MLSFAQSPIYIKPVSAGTQSKLPSLLDGGIANIRNGQVDEVDEIVVDKKEDNYGSSLKCLVSLFLLGFAGE